MSKGAHPLGPLYFFNARINRVYKVSGTLRPAEHEYAKKMGGHRAKILGIAI